MPEVLKLRFRLRRRDATEWIAINEVLLDSEMGLERDTGKVKIGDGVTPWNDLPYRLGGGGGGGASFQLPASEVLAAGEFVNIWNDGGTAKVRKAAAESGKDAHGFVSSHVAAGATATVNISGNNENLAGMTPGATQYLSATAGQRTETPGTGAGILVQPLGMAVSPTSMIFHRSTSILRI